MTHTKNLRVTSFTPIPSPQEFISQNPLTEKAAQTVIKGRGEVENVLDGKDPRKLVIVGPCSIHDTKAAIEYAERLSELQKKVEDKLIVVMRVYLEKPRTTIGWKGFLYDPFLDNSQNLSEGVRLSRELLVAINELGLPTAAEILSPLLIQYYSDLISWSVVGARTAESQTHRELASGLSVAVGFKNGTEGNLDIALNAIISSKSGHSFLGMDEDGKVTVVHTSGNPYGHIILRGGKLGPNYSSEHIAETEKECGKAGVAPRIIVDCSHGNSEKDFKNQGAVWRDVWGQIKAGNKSIIGMMLESNLKSGSQSLGSDLSKLQYGVSITDSCIGFEETEKLIMEAYQL